MQACSSSDDDVVHVHSVPYDKYPIQLFFSFIDHERHLKIL